MRKVAFAIGFFLLSASVFGQNAQAVFDLSNYGVRIEPDQRLTAVLAALEMARDESGKHLLNTPLSASGTKFRTQLDTDFADLPADLRQKISTFVSLYKKRHAGSTDAELVAPFISMAYALTPAPELADPVVTGDLPGQLLDVLDFAPLVREFYRRSGFSARASQYGKDYQAASDSALRGSAREMVSDLLDYLHTRPETTYAERVKTQSQKSKGKSVLSRTEVKEHDRRFFIVPEMLAPAGSVNFLNIRDDYYVIVPPETNLNATDARRAFLQFVVDSLVLKNAKEISTISPGIKTLLDERRKVDPSVTPDVYLTVSRSLVAAADARQREYLKDRVATEQARVRIEQVKTVDEKKAVSAELEKFKQQAADETALQLSEEYEKGSVLSFYFADQLKGLEDSGFDIASSMREIILSFDPAKETGRLAQFAEARKRAAAAREERRKNPEIRAAIIENPVTSRLLEIQKTIDAKDFAKASADLQELLKANPSEPRIFYNIGRVAGFQAEGLDDAEAQNRKLIDAKNAYTKALQSATPATDRALLSLTYVALAKIYEFYNDAPTAVQLYDKAIAYGPLDNSGYSEAIASKQRLLKNQ